MGREVRRVPPDWQHPKEWRWDHRGNRVERYKPLFPGENYQSRVDEWDEECAKWKAGWRPDYADSEGRAMTYEQYIGQRPHRDDYMPNWPAEHRTQTMLFGYREKCRFPLARYRPNVFQSGDPKRHSEKPEAAYELVEAVSPGPRLELFARKQRDDWHTWGNEVPCDVSMRFKATLPGPEGVRAE